MYINMYIEVGHEFHVHMVKIVLVYGHNDVPPKKEQLLLKKIMCVLLGDVLFGFCPTPMCSHCVKLLHFVLPLRIVTEKHPWRISFRHTSVYG